MERVRGFFKVVGVIVYMIILLFVCSIVGPVWLIVKGLEHLPRGPSVYSVDFSEIDKNESLPFWQGGIKRAIQNELVDFDNGKLILHGRPRNGKFAMKEWQVVDARVRYANLRVEVEADKWSPDTSVGFQAWGEAPHYGEPAPYDGIVFKDGCLKITSSAYSGTNEYSDHVDGWETLKKRPLVIGLQWQEDLVTLRINGRVRSSYRGVLIPQKYLTCRVNADRDNDDRLLISSLSLIH